MCCFLTILLFFGPRLAIFLWWLYDQFYGVPSYFNRVWDGNWIIPLLGFIFLPWTLLMYMIVWPGGIVWWEWILIVLALLGDISSYTGGYRNRNYRRT
ncbi:MAG: hypothetical protein R3293_20225 [Candidatus Promineifilaceae bacterium]|nr:hypothetical protein [Candidatus Promineifilaceae bacterium]